MGHIIWFLERWQNENVFRPFYGEGVMDGLWYHPRPFEGYPKDPSWKNGPFLEPSCRYLSPKIDKIVHN